MMRRGDAVVPSSRQGSQASWLPEMPRAFATSDRCGRPLRMPFPDPRAGPRRFASRNRIGRDRARSGRPRRDGSRYPPLFSRKDHAEGHPGFALRAARNSTISDFDAIPGGRSRAPVRRGGSACRRPLPGARPRHVRVEERVDVEGDPRGPVRVMSASVGCGGGAEAAEGEPQREGGEQGPRRGGGRRASRRGSYRSDAVPARRDRNIPGAASCVAARRGGGRRGDRRG